jgi:WD40 repeat protein
MGATDHSVRHDPADDSSLGGRSDSFGLDLVPLDLPAGTDLGGVTIERLIAEGGMGRVYEGRQHAPDRPVAVKVLRSGLASRRLVRRFELEAHLLARLKHPHVAQVHMLGRFRVGHVELPFFVLELVEDARPIDAFARDRGLAVRDRVALLARFAAAVGHGHALGVVHRDLKPGNLLVAADGVPKVIDFGVARAVAADLAPGTLQTDAGEILGTLRYMSPEQCAADPDAIDARADVYALGLVLHELLTGELPYDVRGRSLVAAAQLIREQEAGAMRRVAGAVAGAAGVDGSAAIRLAAIVEKCLQKPPGGRYATAAALADDLGRWLAGEPIVARPPSIGERIGRRLRRHRAAVVAAAIACLAVGIAAASIAAAGRRARHREITARQERALAEGERARAEAAGFTARLAEAAAARSLGDLPRARRLVAEAAGPRSAGGRPPIEWACLAAAVAEPPDAAVAVLEGHAARVNAVAAAPSGTLLATGAEDGSARLWRRDDTGRWLRAGDLTGHRGGVWAAAFSPDGTRVATAAADRKVRLWDTATLEAAGSLAGHTGGVYGLAFAADGLTLATGGADDTVRLWDAADGSLRATLSGHGATVFGLAFSPAGGLLASAAGDGTVRLWDPADGRPVATLAGHARRVFNVAFSPDGRSLVSAGEDGTCRLWSVPDAALAAVLRHPERVNAAVFSATGDRVATASTDGVLRLWDPATAEVVASLRGHAAGIWSLAAVAGPAGPSWLTGSADTTARIWDDGRDVEPRLTCKAAVLGVALAPGGGAAAALASGEVVLFDPATCRETLRLRAGRGRTSAVDFSPDGRLLAAAAGDGTVRIWRAADGAEAGAVAGHRGKVYGVAISPDGRRVASCGEDRTARIGPFPAADTADAAGRPDRRLPHPRRVYGVAWSPAGDLLATACEDGIVRLWPAEDDASPRELIGHADAANWVTFSRDGTRLASCSSDGTVRLWDPNDGRTVATLGGITGQVWEVAFSPDGDRIAAVGSDAKLHLYAAEDGRPLVALDGHRERVWAVAFAADGRTLVTGSADGTARVWGLSAAEVAARRRLADAAAAPP